MVVKNDRPFRILLILQLAVMLASMLTLTSCGSHDVIQNISAEERFNQGKKRFDDGDYLEAINDFQIVKLQFPGSNVADDAQFYLAECHYDREEFLLAAEEYQSLKRTMASSSFVPRAQHRVAMCYYRLSPKATLDQRYALRAIDEFQSFIEYYPHDELVPDAEAKITELNSKLAQKLFESADVYMKLEYYRSATFYYDMIAEKYHDTPFAEPALLGKVKCLVTRKKFAEARTETDKFLERFPNSSHKSDIESMRSMLDDRLNNQRKDQPQSSVPSRTIPHF